MLGIGAWANWDCKNFIRCDKFCGLPPLIVIVESFNKFLLLVFGDIADVLLLFAVDPPDVATAVDAVVPDEAPAPPVPVAVFVDVPDCTELGFVVDDIAKCCICSEF